MNHPPKCLASSAFPEPAVTAEHNCMTWESQGSNEMHTLSATSSSRHNSEQQLKSKLKYHWIVSAIVRLSPVNKPAWWYIVNQDPFTLSCSHAWLLPKRALLQPLLSVYVDYHQGGMECTSNTLRSHTSLRRGVCLNLLIWAVCVLLLHGGKCFD